MKRFAIIAPTVWGNRGAEAMLETAIGRLRDREPDATFVVLLLPARDRRPAHRAGRRYGGHGEVGDAGAPGARPLSVEPAAGTLPPGRPRRRRVARDAGVGARPVRLRCARRPCGRVLHRRPREVPAVQRSHDLAGDAARRPGVQALAGARPVRSPCHQAGLAHALALPDGRATRCGHARASARRGLPRRAHVPGARRRLRLRGARRALARG